MKDLLKEYWFPTIITLIIGGLVVYCAFKKVEKEMLRNNQVIRNEK